MENRKYIYLASAELAAVCSILGKIPTAEEYMTYAHKIHETAEDSYRYLNFDQIKNYQDKADTVKI
jgi:aconitate hydratase 2/2-methylisocitrate dehydratase